MSDTTLALMRERLAALAPESLEIEDESAQHAGHEGAKGGGGHYRMTIVTKQFAGLNPVARHRVIYQALGDLIGRHIHALSINAFTPEEF